MEPAAFRVVNGKLYLNYNADVRKEWSKDIPGMLSKGRLELARGVTADQGLPVSPLSPTISFARAAPPWARWLHRAAPTWGRDRSRRPAANPLVDIRI